MKIGIAVWDLNISGGTQRQALELASNLQNMGHEIVLYTVYYNDGTCYPELLSKFNVNYLVRTDSELSEGNRDSLFKKILSGNLGLLKTIRDFVDLFDADLDLLNIHDYLTYFVVSSFKNKYKIPVVWMMNDLPLDEKDTLPEKIKSYIFGFQLKRRLIKNHIDKIDTIVVLDNWNKGKMKTIYGKDAVVIRSGLDIGNYVFKSRSRNNKLVIFSNGIFFPWRRFEDLIYALKIIKDKGIDFECHHVGSDKRDKKYASKIYQIVQELGLTGNIKFHGYVSEETLIDLYSTSDVFVFPNYPQTWGLAVFEAMACGTPVICSTGAGAHEVLTNGYDAILVPPKSPDKIAENIIELYSNDVLWDKLHKNGRQFVEENISWDNYSENMLAVFNETLRRYHENSI